MNGDDALPLHARRHTVVDRFRHFGRQVDLLDTPSTTSIPSAAILFGLMTGTLPSSQPLRALPLRQWRYLPPGSNFIFCTRRTGVQRVTYFEVRRPRESVTISFTSRRPISEADGQRTYVSTALPLAKCRHHRCQVVTAEIADAPFDVRVDVRSFFSLVTKRSAWLSMV